MLQRYNPWSFRVIISQPHTHYVLPVKSNFFQKILFFTYKLDSALTPRTFQTSLGLSTNLQTLGLKLYTFEDRRCGIPILWNTQNTDRHQELCVPCNVILSSQLPEKLFLLLLSLLFSSLLPVKHPWLRRYINAHNLPSFSVIVGILTKQKVVPHHSKYLFITHFCKFFKKGLINK